MSKAFRIFWRAGDGVGGENMLCETDEPVLAEYHYLKNAKTMRFTEPGAVLILASTEESLVPNAEFLLDIDDSLTDLQRERCEERKWRFWAMPEEARMLGRRKWQPASNFAVKAMKMMLQVERDGRGSGKSERGEMSPEELGVKLGRSSRSVRYYTAVKGEKRSISYTDWRAMLEMAGFKVKPWDSHLMQPENRM